MILAVKKITMIPITLKFEKFLLKFLFIVFLFFGVDILFSCNGFFSVGSGRNSHIESTVVADKLLQVSLIGMICSNCDASFAIE